MMLKALTGMMMMAAVALTFSSCGGGDDAPSSQDNPAANNGGGNGGGGTVTGVFQGARRVFGNNLVKAYGREGYDRYTVTYDDNGFVTKVHRDRYQSGTTTIDKTEDVLVTYNGSTATGAKYKNGVFEGNTLLNFGSNGFVSTCNGVGGDISAEYDADGHMIKETFTETGHTPEVISLNWQNGDLVTGGWDGSGQTSIAYTDATHGTPIENVSGVMEWDYIMGIDMDDDITYYIGAIGFGTKHLPLAWSHGGTYPQSATIAWTLDAQGRAVKAVVTKTTTYSTTPSVYTFFWEY